GLLSGRKTWSSGAAVADGAFGLFRTDPDAGRHGGLTYLAFDLRADGVTVRPIRQLGGQAGFAEIFLDDVFVPDADVIGAVGAGWRVAMSTAGHERGLSLRSPGRFVAAARRLVDLWRDAGEPGDTALRDRVLDAADVATVARRWAGGDPVPGRELWRRLAGVGVTDLAGDPVALVLACEELGHHAVPGPVAESLAAVPALLAALPDAVVTTS